MKSAIFDNEGEYVDRYTFINENGDMFVCNSKPFHPQGIGMYCGNVTDCLNITTEKFIKDAIKDKRLGKLVSLNSLPKDVKDFIKEKKA